MNKIILTSLLIIASIVCKGDPGIKVCSHRGAWSANDNNGVALPENSRAALLRAIELNSDYAECDIYMTSDKKIVVSHDGNTERCFPNQTSKSVTKSTLAELRTLKMTNEETIPTLDEFLTIIKSQPQDGHLTKLLIEVKDQPEISKSTKLALNKVFHAGMEDMCEWISFNSAIGPIVKAKYGKANKTTNIGFLTSDTSDFDKIKANGFNMIDCNGLSDANALAATKAGLIVSYWTYDDVEGMKSKMLPTTFSITTNQTLLLQKTLNSR